MPEEGSVEVDGEGFDSEGSEESQHEDQDQHIDNQDDSKEGSTKEEESEESSENGEESQETEEGKEGEESKDGKKTDKGTKLAEDPLSAANQLRANAEAKTKEYEEFFADPKNVRAYLADLEKENGDSDEEDLISDPSKIETTADLQSYAKYLDRKTEKALRGLTEYAKKNEAEKQRSSVVSNITNDLKAVQSEYTELRPVNPDGTPNPDFDEELEAELGALIHELDFNPNIVNADGSKGNYMGKVSYKRIADRFMKAARRGETTGSKKAQTIVKDRRSGKIKGSSSGGDNQPDESNMSASQMIAARMQRVRGR